MLGTKVSQVGRRASEEGLRLRNEDSTKVGRSRQKAEGSGFAGWRTGSFKPVFGDGFEDGVLFCRQKASAFFDGSVIGIIKDEWISKEAWNNK